MLLLLALVHKPILCVVGNVDQVHICHYTAFRTDPQIVEIYPTKVSPPKQLFPPAYRLLSHVIKKGAHTDFV